MIAGWMKKLISVVLIILAAFLMTPVHLYALEAGVNADLATIAYIAGLPVGMVMILIGGLLERGSDQNREHNDGTPTGPTQVISLKRLIFAFILIAIIVLAIYPIRVYAPQAKVSFIPLIYWCGVILGTSPVWIVISPKIRGGKKP